MPTYDYRCRKCSHTFEEFLPMHKCHAPTKAPCPECKCEDCVDKSFAGVPAVHFESSMRASENKSSQFKEVMDKVSKATGVRGTQYERKIKDKYL